MRLATAIVISILTLSLGYGTVVAQTGDDWLSSIHMFDALTGWAVSAEGWSGVVAKGAVESIVRTADGGIHWRDVTPHAPPGQRVWRPVYAVDWRTSLIAWVSTILDTPTHDTTVLFRTVDGGRTWKSVTLPFLGWIMDFTNAQDGWMLSENDVYHSTDAGETWTKIASLRHGSTSSDLPFRQIRTLTFPNATTGLVTGFRDTSDFLYLYVTRDGGYTWRQQKLPMPSQAARPGAIGEPPTFFTMQDGILPAPYDTPNSGMGCVLYVTHDGGTTWTYATPISPKGWYRSSSFADVTHGWVTDGDALYVTSDGGRRWATIRPGPPFAYVSELDFISPQVGWATGQALFPPTLLKTIDGGHTWKNLPYTISR